MSRPKHSRSAFTLIESLIVMSIMLVILVAAQQFVKTGVDFYRSSVQNLEVQQATMLSLTRIVDELEDTSLDKVFVPAAPANDAIVYPSPLKLDGTRENSDKGIVLWQSIVCLALRTLPDGERVIERKVEAHPPVDYPPDPLSIVGGARDVAYFAGLPATSIVAHHVAAPVAGDPPAFELAKSTDKITISLKVEFSYKWSQGTKDSMKVQTHVFPRY